MLEWPAFQVYIMSHPYDSDNERVGKIFLKLWFLGEAYLAMRLSLKSFVHKRERFSGNEVNTRPFL